MATRLKPTRINVDNTPRVGDGAAYQNDNDFHWSMGGGDMTYRDFEWHTLTGTSLVIEDISNNITPSSNFTVSAGTVKPGIEYVLRVNTGNTPYTMTLGTGVTNPNGYSTELTPNKVNQFKFIATSDSQLELEGVDTSDFVTLGTQQTITAKKTFDVEPELGTAKTTDATNNGTKFATEAQVYKKLDSLTILSYGNSTWNDFITAYNKNAVIYCRASSNSNPATGAQNRLAFMAYVNNATNPTEVEFQYYRSRSSHSTAQNQQDEVYVYKLTSTSGGTWTVEVRDTAAKAIAGTGIGLTFNSSGMTISADTSVLATKTDLNSKQDTLVSGTNIKTVNSNSLLGSGDITLNDVKVSSTAPSSPTEGMVWYDTTNDQLKVYDGTNWQVTGKEYNAGPGIEIGTIQDYSAMRGPCPEGFHIPNDADVNLLISIKNTLSIDGTYFKLPVAGYINTSGQFFSSGNQYWKCTQVGSTSNNFYTFDATLGKGGYQQTYGMAIRPFKDTPVIPDNSWTTLYDGSSVATGAGVFHNVILGLISASKDGTNWITISDKNLGATAVYNNGDTLTDANCGGLFQGGNNYMFGRANVTNTSSTQVDASNYGPGNYYYSSTFITGNRWDSSYNTNLRGGETGVVTLDNAISNTGVLSVNGKTGYVAVKEYNAGEGIEIGTYQDYSAMRGPCPEGYHVPTKDEWLAVYNIGNTLGLWTSGSGSNIQIYLKLPKNGFIENNGAYQDSYKGVTGFYFSCSLSGNYPYAFSYKNNEVRYDLVTRKSRGYGIRGFKDSPVIPDSSWTTLYDGSNVASGAGIFHNSTLGLISISGDGITWITIADKNLGATTIYNNGDTLSQANCGNFYQRGNNYGFPFSGSITTSATQVDASNYGPGNYYSSSTFITRSSSPYDWSSVPNANLRGGVTGVITIDNAITNTGVLSVNGQTGNVTIQNENNVKVFETANNVVIQGGDFTNDATLVTQIQEMVEWLTEDSNHAACIVYKENSGGSIDAVTLYVYEAENTTMGASDKLLEFYYMSQDGDAIYYQYGHIDIISGAVSSASISNRNVVANKFSPLNSGTTGQVLTKTSSGYNWQTPTGLFQLAPNSPLNPKYRRYGTQAQYEALTQYYTDEPGDTVYFTI